MLSPVEGQILPTDGSNKKLYFNCSCGNQNVLIRWKYFKNGITKTCGKCGILPASHWKSTTYGKLRMKFPIDTHKSSNKKTTWMCDCGNETEVQIYLVTNGNTSSCGKCNILSTSHWYNAKYGKLKLKVPQDLYPNSHQKVTWVYDCENETEVQVCNVILGKQKTCGKCNILESSHWENTKYGKLRLKNPQDLYKGSDKIVTWVCDCGNEHHISVYEVTSGGTKSCGKCKHGKLKLKTAKNLHKGSSQSMEWECNCGNETNTAEITEFIESLGLEVKLEYAINSLKYDICVPSKNLVIEYNGLRWHGMPLSRKRDVEKYKNSVSNGYDHVMIFEDEWLFNGYKVRELIRNRLGINSPQSLRPSKCVVQAIKSSEADPFYNQFHYIGICKAPVNYGVFIKTPW